MDLVVEYGRKVAIEYTLRLDDGTVAESNLGGEPLRFLQGLEQVLPALEEALEGKATGDRVVVTLPPERAYGAYDPALRQEVPLDRLPREGLVEGATLVAQPEGGGAPCECKLLELREATALVDLNHPVAGRTVCFEIRIVAIE